MSATSAPFGLRPVNHPSGQIRPVAMTILSGYATAILRNQPIKVHTDGTIQAAAVTDRFIGSFQGVEYTDANGRRQIADNWVASTVGTDIVAYVTRDPLIVYEIQSNAALNILNIGEQYNFTAASGSTINGSTQMLDVASTAANAEVRLLGITPGSDNNWGDTYVIAQVQISKHQFVADVAAF
jgi:hypothetical protein